MTTTTIERHHDVGLRRPRHRLAEPLGAAVLGTVADAARDVGRAIADRTPIQWTARMTARVIGVLIVAVAMILGFGVLIATAPPSGATPTPAPGREVTTPSVTPYPGGWTYAPR
jgi:hypothetical protein